MTVSIRFRCLLLALALAGSTGVQAQEAAVLKQQDASIIESLQAIGSNLGKPHQIDFYFTFAGEAAANSAVKAMQDAGYTLVVVEPALDGDRTQVQMQRALVPALDTVHAASLELSALARGQGGEYDGWSAVPVE